MLCFNWLIYWIDDTYTLNELLSLLRPHTMCGWIEKWYLSTNQIQFNQIWWVFYRKTSSLSLIGRKMINFSIETYCKYCEMKLYHCLCGMHCFSINLCFILCWNFIQLNELWNCWSSLNLSSHNVLSVAVQLMACNMECNSQTVSIWAENTK